MMAAMAGLAMMPTAARGDDGSAAPAEGLRWHGPAGCSDGVALRSRVEARLERPLDDSDDIAVEVEIATVSRGLDARLRLHRGGTVVERTLTAARCADITEAVAIVVALALTADRNQPAEAASPDAPPALPAMTPPPMTPPAAIAAAPTAVAAVPRRWSLGVRLQVGQLAGALPATATGAELAVWLAWRGALVEIASWWWQDRRADLDTDDGAGDPGVDVGLTAIAGRLCWRPLDGAVRACAIGELGELAARGVDLIGAQRGVGRWTALGAGAAGRVGLAPHLGLVTAGELLRPIDPPRFVLSDGTVLFEAEAVAARLSLGLEFFW
jgi:hypothetical protein